MKGLRTGQIETSIIRSRVRSPRLLPQVKVFSQRKLRAPTMARSRRFRYCLDHFNIPHYFEHCSAITQALHSIPSAWYGVPFEHRPPHVSLSTLFHPHLCGWRLTRRTQYRYSSTVGNGMSSAGLTYSEASVHTPPKESSSPTRQLER